MATVKKFKTPACQSLCVTPDNPTKFQIAILNTAIKTLRDMGVPVYSDTTKFDPRYPRLVWDGEQVTQTVSSQGDYMSTGRKEVTTIEEFVALFEVPEYITVDKISKDYNAKVFPDRIEVGCQTISAEKFKGLIEAAKDMGILD